MFLKPRVSKGTDNREDCYHSTHPVSANTHILTDIYTRIHLPGHVLTHEPPACGPPTAAETSLPLSLFPHMLPHDLRLCEFLMQELFLAAMCEVRACKLKLDRYMLQRSSADRRQTHGAPRLLAECTDNNNQIISQCHLPDTSVMQVRRRYEVSCSRCEVLELRT